MVQKVQVPVEVPQIQYEDQARVLGVLGVFRGFRGFRGFRVLGFRV